MLEVRNLTKRYNGLPAVHGVNFTLRPGEIPNYVGPNGAGNSTTVKMIVGLLEPSEGQILHRNASVIDRLPGFQPRLDYFPEEPHWYLLSFGP
jgi:ABC-2 type transport system ATP-binding protein